MRMRRKKWAVPELTAAPFYIRNPEEQTGHWRALYARAEQPLMVELGCGKGGFISRLALQNPQFNFLAVDLIDDMLGLTKRAVEQAYREAEREIDNVLLAQQDIERITRILGERDQVERVYINFCNPWPKAGHKKRRLTHPKQLRLYRQCLVPGGQIYFKTDDRDLFEDSLRYLDETGFVVEYLTRDLHASGYQGNIETEHERMFSAEGVPIKFLIATMGGPPKAEG